MRTSWLSVATALVAVTLAAPPPGAACTNILVTRGASTDGSTFISYAADSHELYGELYLTSGGQFPEGATRDIIEWDTGKFLGRIKQARQTYWTVGNINEHQVSIGETTFTGREELKDPKAIVDYGSLMFIALERAKTAREAIKVMTDLVAEYGYASTGETFSIADPNEAWIMDLISKGPDEKGAVWVARRVPDGFISGHANQARIRQFPRNDPDTLFAPDVVTFAQKKGYFKGEDKDFSFVDAYAPPDFGALRFCESRVWSVFRRAAPSQKLDFEYVKGNPKAEPLPLWIKPDHKISVADMFALMRDHFEGTEFDLSQGIGAGPFACPYRWRPMTWEVDGKPYLHERAISTQQTGYSFISQMRAGLPDTVGGIEWFGVDDTYSTVYIPMYCSIRAVPKPFAVGVADLFRYSPDSGFWVFNWVANWAYSRYSDMIRDVQHVQRELEGTFLADQKDVEAEALVLFKQSPGQARDYLTRYSVAQGEMTVARWRTLGEQLLVKYMDGNLKSPSREVDHPKYPDFWYRTIVKERGDILSRPEEPKH
ncbi:MAG TPA: C69 family dipeptidase [Thermoanaerobaculaceae bacterium]|nr:C69 family dipeptidase [Thermoanaerobaculaceae bacterium]